MRAVIQRVLSAAVRVDGELTGRIDHGLLVYLGAAAADTRADVELVAAKIAGLRVFEDADGKMNADVRERGGAVLVVSQFTLFGDVRRGRRPSFIGAAAPEHAAQLYDEVCERLRVEHALHVETGRFRAHMHVESVGDGPVTILVDSTKLF